MTEAPSRSVRLFGTDQPVAPPRVLKAGPLTAELEAGNLRYIRFSGLEMIRAISFIVRDKNWGTYDPAISDLVVEESGDRFRVAYSAVAKDAAQGFAYEAEITGSADGSLRFAAKGRALTDFLTNRTGFVVLHPASVAGKTASVTETTGRAFDTKFPELIDPGAADDEPARHRARLRPGSDRRVPHGRRHLRDGRPAQLDRCLLQDLCPAARAALALHARERRHA